MQLQQLKYFVAVAEVRHFTHAADLVGITQPSLSKQIHALETDLGTPLFERVRGNIALTAAGETLLPVAKRILADVESARGQVQELVGVRRGRVRLGATPSLCTSLAPPVLRRFHDRHPEVDLGIEEGGSQDLVRDLLRGELDLALIIEPDRGVDPGLRTEPLLRESLVVASLEPLLGGPAGPPGAAGLPAGRPGAATAPGRPQSAAGPDRRPAPAEVGPVEPRVEIGELRDRPMVMFRGGYDLRDATLAACRRAGFEPRFAVEGGEMDAVLSLVEAGLGIALVPGIVLARQPRVHVTQLAPPGIHRTIALARRREVALSHAAQELRRILLEFVRENADGGNLPRGVEAY
ncbi:LysR family transcriptional regulator [Plantactinospora siamensis]|uniref:LysR family transcriptional regulator n=1 Tax=Plantactinospora siamensis TaxID=555372 RepID=A0ABV6P0Q5_9ACTN